MIISDLSFQEVQLLADSPDFPPFETVVQCQTFPEMYVGLMHRNKRQWYYLFLIDGNNVIRPQAICDDMEKLKRSVGWMASVMANEK